MGCLFLRVFLLSSVILLVSCGEDTILKDNSVTNSNSDIASGSKMSASAARGKILYESSQQSCLSCHGADGLADTFKVIDLTADSYQHSASPGVGHSLEDYMVQWMPVTNPSLCVGECAVDIASYIRHLGSAVPEESISTSTPEPVTLHERTKALMEKTCASSGCHDASPGVARIDLLSGDLETFAARLVDIDSGSSLCAGEKIIDFVDPSNSLFLKLTDPDFSDPCTQKMPILSNGVSPANFDLLEKWVNEVVSVSAIMVEPPVVEQRHEPLGAFAILKRIKNTLHGGAVTSQEYEQAINSNDQLNVSGLQSVIRGWTQTDAYKRKMRNFFASAFQQLPNHITGDRQYFAQFRIGRNKFCRSSTGTSVYSAFEETGARTAEWLMNTDQDFRKILNGDSIVTTTMGLLALVQADQTWFGAQDGERTNFCETEGIIDADYTDWRPVKVGVAAATPAESSISESFIRRIRDIGTDGQSGVIDFAIDRRGICNSLVFNMSTPWNFSNVYRQRVSQCMIAALGLTYEVGDTTPTNNVDGVDVDHAKPGTDCYSCHEHMDPMANLFKKQYPLFGNDARFKNLPSYSDLSTDFSFHGHSAPVNDMEGFNQALHDHPEFANGLVKKLIQWSVRQEIDNTDAGLRAVVNDFKASGYRFNELIVNLFTHPMMTTVEASGLEAKPVLVSRDNYCLSLQTRLEQWVSEAGYEGDSKIYDAIQGSSDLCHNRTSGRIATKNLPADVLARTQVEFVQTTKPSLIALSFFSNACNNHFASLGRFIPLNESLEPIEALTQYIANVPSSHPRFTDVKALLQKDFDVARAMPECTSLNALEQSISGSIQCGLGLINQHALAYTASNACMMGLLDTGL